MALNIKNEVVFLVRDAAGNYLFQSSPMIDYPVSLTQVAGTKLDVPASTMGMLAPNLGAGAMQRVYLVADQALTVQIVPVGGSVSTTPSMTLVPNAPTILSMSNIGQVFISNPTTNNSLLIFCGVG